MPVHGTWRMLRANAALAARTGVPEENIVLAENGYGPSNISNCAGVTVALPPEAPVLEPIPGPSTDGHITLAWNPDGFVESWDVYRDAAPITDTGGLSPVATGVGAPSHTDRVYHSGLYYYVVVAHNAVNQRNQMDQYFELIESDPNLQTTVVAIAPSDGMAVTFVRTAEAAE